MEGSRKSTQDICFLNIDFEKMYDQIQWNFILDSMRSVRFGHNFISMVNTVLVGASTSICVDESLSSPFDLTCSIRQGYLEIYPLLFATPLKLLF